MKEFMLAWAIAIVCVIAMIGQEDTNMHQRQMQKLKFVAEEAAAAGAQYYVKEEYAKGNYVFNKAEGTKAAEYYIKKNLKLDDNFNPTGNNYWTDKVTYTIEFYDDSNTKFPYLYNHSSGMLTKVLTSPSVVVCINTGKPRYRNVKNPPAAFRVAAHSLKER